MDRFATPMEVVNVDRVQLFVDMGRLDAGKTITIKDLVDCGLVKASRVKHGIKLLGKVRRFTSVNLWCQY